MIKYFCDKCGEEIKQGSDSGHFVYLSKEIALDPKTKRLSSGLKSREFQLCEKHGKEILEFIQNKDKKLKVE